jgi:hypothetical protein
VKIEFSFLDYFLMEKFFGGRWGCERMFSRLGGVERILKSLWQDVSL